MTRVIVVALLGLATAACPDTRPGDEPPVEAVSLDTLSWAVEGRTVEHEGGRYAMVGPPVFEPVALTRVGEFEGTPLYAERAVASPPRRLFIPVGGGYWQMLEYVAGREPATPMEGVEPEIQPGTEGVAP